MGFSETNKSEMDALSSRAEQLIDSITNAILSTAESAAERIELASRVAQVRQRMAAFASVLEAVETQKAALAERLDSASGPMRVLLQRQIDMLTEQETAVLGRAGVAAGVPSIDSGDSAAGSAGTHKRTGRRFVPVANSTGVPLTDSAAH